MEQEGETLNSELKMIVFSGNLLGEIKCRSLSLVVFRMKGIKSSGIKSLSS